MKYNFTKLIDRRGKDAIAIDEIGGFDPGAPKKGFDAIPMWVADMNFETAPSIVKHIQKRLEHPLFGYFRPSEEYYDAIISWQKRRNQVKGLKKEYIGYENGVLGGVSSALSILCEKGGNVLLHSPCYVGFIGTLTNNGYHLIYSPLVKDEKGIWRMDYQDMDKKIKENHIHVAIFCSPHNPTGRVWSKEEISKAIEVYRKNNVYVISDEIWSDLVLEGKKHIPTQSISKDAKERTIALYAPSKTFSLAGLVGAYHIIYNPYLRERMDKQTSLSHYNSMNVLSMHGLIGGYNEGEKWLDELRQVLTKNVKYGYDYVKKHFDGVEVSMPEGTYMLYMDAKKWCEKHNVSNDELIRLGWDVGVAWQDGRQFNGEYCIRLNLALPFVRVKEAFKRMDQYVFNKKA